MLLPEYTEQGRDSRIDSFYSIFKDYVKEGDWFLDIGANFGEATIAAGRLVGSQGLVIAVEPNPIATDILKENCKSQNVPVHIHNLAFSDTDEACDFIFNRNNDNGGILKEFESVRDGVLAKDIKCVNGYKYLIDKYSDNLQKIRFIKIDAEGMDVLILNNMLPIIKENKIAVLFEDFPFIHEKCISFIESVKDIYISKKIEANFLLQPR